MPDNKEQFTHLLKQRASRYFPSDLNGVEAQRQILRMAAAVISSAEGCVAAADRDIWPKAGGELPMGHAIAQCAFLVNKAIGSGPAGSGIFRNRTGEELLKAWIALDYYSYVLKPEYSGNIRTLRDQLTELLYSRETGDGPTAALAPRSGAGKIAAKAPAPKAGKKSLLWVVLLIAVLAVVGAALLLPGLSGDAAAVEKAIDRIGTVSLESGPLIEAAEAAYEALGEGDREKVENYPALLEARAELDRLLTQQAIAAIGKVTLESGDAIAAAEAKLEALPEEKRAQVENADVLEVARAEYERLEAAVQKASDAIDAIGEVTLESGEKIRAARDAYDALAEDDLQDYLSDKYAILADAEAAYGELAGRDACDRAQALLQEEEYTSALELFEKVLTEYPYSSAAEQAREGEALCRIGLAEEACEAGELYTAAEWLDDVDENFHSLKKYGMVSKKLEEKLARNRPTNGRIIGTTLERGKSYFQVTAAEQDICIRIEDANDPTLYRMIYVQAGKEMDIYVQDGTYVLKWAAGETWFDDTHFFGDETRFEQVKGTVTLRTEVEKGMVNIHYFPLDLNDPACTILSIDGF